MTGCCAGVRRPRAGDRVGACGIRRTCRERVGLGGESWVTGRCTGVRRPLAGDRAGVCSIQGDSQNIPGRDAVRLEWDASGHHVEGGEVGGTQGKQREWPLSGPRGG